MTPLSENLRALHEPEFRKLFLGQAASIAGSMLTLVALPFAVLSIGGSATDIGIVEAAYALPMALMIVVGGVWSDRVSRRKVMLTADLVRAALQSFTAGLLLVGAAEVWMLLLLQTGMGLCDAFFRPAYTGLVPQVVSSGRLQQANALQGGVDTRRSRVAAQCRPVRLAPPTGIRYSSPSRVPRLSVSTASRVSE